MKTAFKYFPMALLCLMIGCQSAALNVKAQAATKDALTGPLQQLAIEAPDTSTAIAGVFAQWGVIPESQTYADVEPLIARYKLLHPSSADGLDRTMRNWKDRIAKFSTTQGAK